MVIFLQGCWVYKMTGLCLPWTWGCRLLRSFQQSLGVMSWHSGRKASGKSLVEKTVWIRNALSGPWVLTEFSSGLAGLYHSQASMHSQAWTCSERAPDSQGSMQPLRVRGHCATNQSAQVECCTAAPRLHFPTPPGPTMIGHWHAVSAALS